MHAKASKVKSIPQNWLGTLEAIILKMPTRHRHTEPLVVSPVYEKDEEAGRLIEAILARYPQHKRVLFLKSRYEENRLTRPDMDELKKFGTLPGVQKGGADAA